ncbi:protocatechuate 3,4-dioxygenase subunit alpha [Poseidonocella sedimentorum]|uniref:Protocatechuate 3,4-dioxygenase, alpha subunit n=1 Tax=Poseidonocella sedimentorum TaxID=871652 RepID=A0A1I6E0J4_9RHOB|nr:protocatechuate 3,4-dioxygenase subunit alpha [Poseidonocella sedimentorum]SFR11205.1 protocatechuate 3,4-dioxygenase, alpha subunit [Poseidonocella sedimentorum]
MRYLKETPSQTAGPYVHIGCVPSFAGLEGMFGGRDLGDKMITGDAKGERITLTGHVHDGTGMAIRDALLEIWQADAAGLYNSPQERRGAADPHFTGWGRQPTDGETGRYRFETIKPGPVPWSDGRMQAPHILVWIVARGINMGLATRVYFDDEQEANAADPLLARIEHRDRIPTLLARREGDTYHFDIHLQGPDETIFFDI